MDEMTLLREQVRKVREKNECERRLLLHNLSIIALRESPNNANEILDAICEIHVARMKGVL